MRRRDCLRAGSITFGAMLSGCWLARSESPPYHAQVSQGEPPIAGVPHYRDIAAALRAAPANGATPFRILIDAGIWHEKLVVDKPNVHLVGTGRAQTRLRFDAAAGHIAPNGQPWGTWGCATMIVRAPGFAARDLSIENCFDYLEHLSNPKLQQVGANGAQAVALMLDQGADRSVIERVDISSHQDTLFADAGRSRFRDCRIQGSVDFVFGAGRAVLDRCTLHSRFRPGKERQGYVAAPSTRNDAEFGLCFLSCALTRDKEIPNATVALGRAWRPTRAFTDGSYGDPDVLGAAAYLNCTMDAHIGAQAWDEMAYTARDGSRIMLAPQDARLREYRSRGTGAVINEQRRQLGDVEANHYTLANILGDWSGSV